MHLLALLTFGVTAIAGASLDDGFGRYYRTEPGAHGFPQTPLDDLSSYLRNDATDSKTVYDVLKDDEQYSKLVKAIDFVGDDVIDILNDTSSHITFFASPNKALHVPDDEQTEIRTSGLPKAIQLLEEFETPASRHDNDDDKDKDKDKQRKKLLKKALRAILYYHILPSKFDTSALTNNNTFDTELVLPGVLERRSLRIRVTRGIIPPTPIINLYSRVIQPNVQASNGIIHGVDHPLLPPPSVFQELFMAPSMFSIFTSAVQRTGLADEIDFRYVHRRSERVYHHRKSSFRGTSAVTVFAPTNAAFLNLPAKLRLFLFSPFGERALKKILEYHIVPDYVFHTDYRFNASQSSSEAGPEGPRLQENLIFSYNRTLPTALKGCPLHAHAEKFNITLPIPGPNIPYRTKTNLFINDRPVHLADVVGLNGAFHVIDSVLDPRVCHKHDKDRHQSWKDWPEWLEDWAFSD